MALGQPGFCNWCERPSAGELILKKGNKNKLAKTASACHVHIIHFNKQGILTTQQASRAKDAD